MHPASKPKDEQEICHGDRAPAEFLPNPCPAASGDALSCTVGSVSPDLEYQNLSGSSLVLVG